MADAVKNMKIVLELDGQKFEASLKRSGKGTSQLGKEAAAASNSITGLNKKLADAEKRLNALDPKSAKYEAHLKRVRVLSAHASKAQEVLNDRLKGGTGDMNRFGAASGQTAFAILNMNRIVSDAPYGFTAISNNIGPAVQSMSTLIKTSDGVMGALKTLGRSMMGPLGIMVAIEAISAAFTYFSLHQNKAKKETDELKTEMEELTKKVREYKASLQEVEKLENFRLSGASADLKKKQARFKYVFERLKFLGEIGAAEDSGRWGIEYKNLSKEFNQLEVEIASLKDLLKDGSKEFNEYSGIVAKVFPEALKKSGKELVPYLASLGLTINQIEIVKRSLEETTKDLAVNTTAYKENLKAVKNLGDALSILGGKESKSNKGKAQKAITVDVEFIPDTLTKQQHKLLAMVKEQMRAAGIVWNSQNMKWALEVVVTMSGAPNYMFMNPVPKVKGKFSKPEIKLTTAELDTLKFKADLLATAFYGVGDAIVESMFNAKVEVKDLLAEIGKLLIKMTLFAGIKSALSFAFPFLAPFFHTGGIAGAPNGFRTISPEVFNNAPRYHSGTTGLMPGEVPAILKHDEAVLTAEQQANFMGLLYSAVKIREKQQAIFLNATFKNTMDGQKLVLESLERIGATDK